MSKHMKMLRFIFHQNQTINDFFFFEGGAERPDFKTLRQKGCPNPHRKFQHSSSIRKCLKNSGNDSTSGGLKPSTPPSPIPRGVGGLNFKNSKKPHTERWSHTTPKISALYLNLNCIVSLSYFEVTPILNTQTSWFISIFSRYPWFSQPKRYRTWHAFGVLSDTGFRNPCRPSIRLMGES